MKFFDHCNFYTKVRKLYVVAKTIHTNLVFVVFCLLFLIVDCIMRENKHYFVGKIT